MIAVRAGMTILASSLALTSDYGPWLFLFGNASLWRFGSIWGWHQVTRGEYWWMKQNDGKRLALEPAKTAPQQMDKEMEDLLKSLSARDQVITRKRHSARFEPVHLIQESVP